MWIVALVEVSVLLREISQFSQTVFVYEVMGDLC